MIFRHLHHVFGASRQQQQQRLLSTFKYLEITHSENGYSILKLNKAPVNSLNLDFTKEISEAIDYVESRPESNGLVITSNLKVFSAGLDLHDLHHASKSTNRNALFSRFLSASQDLGLKLYQSSLVTMAAINGSAPAGGCAIPLNCDYRIMANGKFMIGFNETQVGLTVPLGMCKLYESLMGRREAEKHLTLGTLFSPEEALNIGLVDKVVAGEDLMTSIDREMCKWLSVPEMGRCKTKQLMHKPYIDSYQEGHNDYLQWFLRALDDPTTQKTIAMYLQSLYGKR